MSDGPDWFAPKRYSIGSVPITWQGWAVLIGFVVLIVLATRLIRVSWIAFVSIAVMLAVVLVVVTARTTRGGWRWRWGEDE